MKLNPPASSSDLETAREIAQRLHQRGRGSDRPSPPPGTAAILGLIPPALTRTPAPPAPAPGAAPTRQAIAPPEPRSERPTPQHSAAAPSSFQPPPFQAQAPPLEPPPVPVAKPTPPPVPPVRMAPRPLAEPPEPPMLPSIEALGELDEPSPTGDESGVDDDSIVIEETDTSIEDMVGAAELPSVEDIVGAAEIASDPEPAEQPDDETPLGTESPFEEAPASPFDDVAPATSVTEELFDMPPPPSWGEIAETCMSLGRARGAMLVDPAGQVFATRGQWPDPGPNAIATKLVAMMEKTLKDAPTRSVSAPLGGLHLTAWRVPLAEGLITAAFIADAPLRAELRTPIDAQILAGEGL